MRVAQERLDEATIDKIYTRLRAADTDDEVAAAWVVVDLLRKMYQAPDRDTGHRRLVAFYEWAAEVDVPEITRLATTIDTWQDEVRGRPLLRTATWRAVWGALRHNPVYAARFQHLTTRDHNRLTDGQARAAVGGSLLRQLHAITTKRTPWAPEVAAGQQEVAMAAA